MEKKTLNKNSLSSRLWNVCKWFDTHTTLGGWEPAFHRENKLFRCLWFLIFLLCVYGTVWGLYNTITYQFLAFNTIISVFYDYPFQLELPAVTICNSNRVHCTNLHKHILQVREYYSENTFSLQSVNAPVIDTSTDKPNWIKI